MADVEDKAKAEKLAAAKKRVEQLKKQKAKKTGAKKEEKEEPVGEASITDDRPEIEKTAAAEGHLRGSRQGEEKSQDAEETVSELSTAPSHQRQPSLSIQSKMRSSSFRQASLSGGPLSPSYTFSPDGDTAPDIHRKQTLKIEELERENKRLSKEAADGEKRWRKAEEDLEDLREAEGNSTSKAKDISSPDSVVERLKTENAALIRQITQLQSQTLRASRHGSSPSISMTAPAELDAALQSKNGTIESMEVEISNLQAQLARVASGSSVEKEQIAALEDKLSRSEKSAAIAQRELADLKKNLDRVTEKVVKEGSERISAETKLRTLEREAAEAKVHVEELEKKVEALEKKAATLATLHKEHDVRFQAQKREREKVEKDGVELRSRLATTENENLRLRDEKERAQKRDAQGIDDEGVDELENEERQKLQAKVRGLEEEVHELRRGVWRERRKELDGEESPGITSPGARFTDVDLGSGLSPARGENAGKGLGDYLTSGFNAITGAVDGGLLEEVDDLDFDEDAFRIAQEEAAKKQLERVKELKRGLKNWVGWRLDLVENRRGGGEGVGAIFEI